MEDKVVVLTLPPNFFDLVGAVHRQHNIPFNTRELPILALDPGETTGVAEYDGGNIVRVYQKETKQIGLSYDWLFQVLESGSKENDARFSGSFNHIRIEDYRVYEWKSADHSWSQVHTLRLIGAFEACCHRYGVDQSYCMAQHAKQWWTDEKLKRFGIYPKGLKHGRDALRHLLYYMLFPNKVNA